MERCGPWAGRRWWRGTHPGKDPASRSPVFIYVFMMEIQEATHTLSFLTSSSWTRGTASERCRPIWRLFSPNYRRRSAIMNCGEVPLSVILRTMMTHAERVQAYGGAGHLK